MLVGPSGAAERSTADTAELCSCGDQVPSAHGQRWVQLDVLSLKWLLAAVEDCPFRRAFSHHFHDHISLLPPRRLQIQTAPPSVSPAPVNFFFPPVKF